MKLFILVLCVLISVSLIGVVSAKTLVAGKIYNADWSKTIPDAKVLVNCNHKGENNSKSTVSLQDGAYAVTFLERECDAKDWVKVDATKDNLYGSASGIVNPDVIEEWNIAIVNVPLVPEFGLIAGMITVLGALGIFFVVRK